MPCWMYIAIRQGMTEEVWKFAFLLFIFSVSWHLPNICTVPLNYGVKK